MAAPTINTAKIATESQKFPIMGTIATPSRNDIIQSLNGMFGPPEHPEKLDEYTDYHAAVYDLPAAYIGRSVAIRDTLNNLITQSVENWQTSDIFPFLRIDGLNVQWDTIEFDRSILPHTPYQGASRLQTSIRRSHRDRVVRRGAAILLENDFYRTPAGITQFSNEILSVQQCVQLTCNYDVLYQVLTNAHYNRDYEIQKRIMNPAQPLSFMRRQIQTYGVLGKHGKDGLDQAIEIGRRAMAQYNVSPDTVIMSPETQIYLKMVPEESKRHFLGGDTAVQSYNNYDAGKDIASYRGMKVYSQQSFDVGTHTTNMNMLERSTQVGEYYVMEPPRVLAGEKLPPNYMDIHIYDETADRQVLITFNDALEHSLVDDDQLIELLKGVTEPDLALHKESAALVTGATAKNDLPTLKAMTKADLKNYVKTGVWVPIKLVITRPFIEHRMLSMAMMVRGSDTGNTAYSQSDFQIASNVNTKMIECHFTFHSKAIVTQPKNIFVVEDAQFNGYVGGCNTKWFGDDKGGTVDATNIKESLAEVLNELDPDSDTTTRPSMLAFAVPLNADFKHHMITINGGALPWSSTGDSTSFPGGTEVFNFYSDKLGLNDISMGTDPSSVSNGNFIRNGSHVNNVCIQGSYRKYNPLTPKTMFMDHVPGQGHLGRDAREGDARWRRGEFCTAEDTRKENPLKIAY